MAAAALLAFLVIARNLGFWGYLARTPGAVDAASVRLWLSHALLPLAGAGVFAVSAWGLGRRLMRRWIGEPPIGAGSLGCVAFGLGLGALACAAAALVAAGFSGKTSFSVLGAVAFLLAEPEIHRAAAERRVAPSGSAGGASKPWRAVLSGLLAYCAWHAAIGALAPPTQWDVLAYHLAIPKLYLSAGGMKELPWLLHSHWPHLMETLYVAALAFSRDAAAALIHSLACAALTAAVYFSARDFLNADAALAASALLAAQPVMLRLSGTAHSDGAVALFHFLSCVCLWLWSSSRGRGWLAAAGALSGLAAASKLLGAVPFSAWCVYVCSRRSVKGGGRCWREACLFAACGLAVAVPWYLKEWLLAGNPVWPFFASRLGGLWGAAALEGPYARSYRWPWPPAPALLLRNGPLFLLAPAALLAASAGPSRAELPPFLRFLWIPAGPYLLLIWRHQEAWRFFLPFFPALALSCGWWLSKSLKRGTGSRLAAAAALALGVSPALAATQNNALFAVAGVRSKAEPDRAPRARYLERSLDCFRLYEDVNRALRPPAKVLLFQEIRGYWLDVDYMWGDPLNQAVLRYGELADSEALRARLAELGVTHVLVNEGLAMYSEGSGYYERRTLDLMREMLRRHARPVLKDGRGTLYALGVPDPNLLSTQKRAAPQTAKDAARPE